ncbi:hypothetical protein [Acinetobacter junii]|uniref:hypothetical protein n=1 Tax=Acinetobacter junii TaxID=40215 RepID=UPI0005B4EC11|nr:hypothetical protein [Acinetobacter junii]MDA3509395.1 hypothetical protein [Acinetobacter junii]MDA3533897.1 hypothetical protein [Acinetobacter junii]
MKLSVVGGLTVAITVLVNNKPIKCSKVELSDLSTGELFDARARAKEGEYLSLHELAAKTKLIDENDVQHEITYEMLRDTSSANFKKLEELDFDLQAKLKAESLESQSS